MPIYPKCPWKKLLHNVAISGRRAKAMTFKRKGIELEVDISIEDLKEIYDKQNGKCFWFDIPIDINSVLEKGNLLSMSADRIDNNKPYTKNNVVFCSCHANWVKGQVTIDMCKKILEVYSK